MSKYHAKKVTVNGITFDSKKEAERYRELLLMQKSGMIRDLRRQVKFVLIPAQRGEHRKVIERECAYFADFVYTENGRQIVEDTKGMRTKDYIIKRKLMLYRYGIKIREV